MGDKKRKREEAAGAAEQKPKRIKNKAKYQPKGNKARKKAAAPLMNGANAIPVGVRESLTTRAEPESESKEDVPMAEAPKGDDQEDKGKESNTNDFFMIDTTPMDAQEVEEKTKSKAQKKKEQKEQQMTKEDIAAREEKKAARKENKKKEDKIKREKNALENKEKREQKEEEKRGRKELIKAGKEKKELAKQEEKRKKKVEGKEEKKESDSSSSDSESEVKQKTTTTTSPKETLKEKNPARGKQTDTKPAKAEEGQLGSDNKSRFIVFVGNLPFTASTDSVKAHFSKIEPISVRVATDKKDTDKCRGFGFVEFEQFDRMQTCLKLYHHSSFDDGKSPARKINVELTAGGGGKSTTRKTKLREKNQKLAEERAKLAAEKGKKKKQSNQDGQQDGNENENGEDAGGEFAGIHPSRLNRMA
ncbi:hypothetical protein UA08_01994 [Talaromyces atroroseus]|uniref:RRM domain-containing protein n=1 Tax=Talaromyces atroroseus TaxID=1441469 RepID=A0A1Q5QAT0_TALAT|nr:hypothetical protein UA08_01994 [Talaromyces atroroseus]OKL62918.1 hypothetical protein UA08_01994 [Talaromyces atroroseus]